MKARNVTESVESSDVRCETSSQITASAGEPTAARSASSEAWETCVSMASIEIEPHSAMPRWRRSAMTTEASSRATSARITSPCGLRAAPLKWATLMTESVASRAANARTA
jgi:hypothetical protein